MAQHMCRLGVCGHEACIMYGQGCMAGGMHGRGCACLGGVHGQGYECLGHALPGGVHGQGVCAPRGIACLEGWGEGVHGQGGHSWLGVCGQGACMVGDACIAMERAWLGGCVCPGMCACPRGGMHGRGHAWPGMHPPPPPPTPRDTVAQCAPVRILLECIIVE